MPTNQRPNDIQQCAQPRRYDSDSCGMERLVRFDSIDSRLPSGISQMPDSPRDRYTIGRIWLRFVVQYPSYRIYLVLSATSWKRAKSLLVPDPKSNGFS